MNINIIDQVEEDDICYDMIWYEEEEDESFQVPYVTRKQEKHINKHGKRHMQPRLCNHLVVNIFFPSENPKK